MKKLLLLLILTLLCGVVKAQYSGPYTPHAPITAVSYQTIRGDSINGGSVPCITIPLGVHDVHIIACKLVNSTPSAHLGAIYGAGGNYNITIDSNYISTSHRGVYMRNALNNIKVNANRFYNIQSPNPGTDGAGNAVQFSGVTGYGNTINYNLIYNTTNNTHIGDQISLFKSGGVDTSWTKIIGNQIRNGSTNLAGFCAINFGDQFGYYIDVEDNWVVRGGFAAFSLTVGTGHHVTIINNIGYSDAQANSNEGLAVKKGFTVVTAGYNRLNWKRKDGVQFNWYTTMSPDPPIGWAGNIDDNAGVRANNSLLPDPLWTDGPVTPVITYTPSTIAYTYGSTIIPLVPVSTGGAVVSYAISPSLPAGLSLNTSTGVITGTPTAAHASTDYVVTATNVSGTGTFTLHITVNKAPLVIIADSKAKAQGTANPTLTVSYYGFVLSDNSASLTTPPTISTTALTGSAAGIYPITASGAVASNYTISCVPGIMLIYSTSIGVVIHGRTAKIVTY